MRLIEAVTLSVKSFDNEANVPPYAILSHTWGESEVTLDALSNSSIPSFTTQARGYRKITLACQQALQDGLAYIWVDTCCIDKSSSAELSEAINSMFKWYAAAEICYAYLDDVEAVLHPYLDEQYDRWFDSWSIDAEELARARWFTRGWTLQELLAPEAVRFYAKGWKYVGTKESLREPLAKITRIDITALDGVSLGAFSVATKMSWAAKRVTSRSEDIAYCLMGLFDVNMPLLYGEGAKAFVRLQEEILKDSHDQSLFAWQTQRSRDSSQHSFDRNACRGVSIFATHPIAFEKSNGINPSTPRAHPTTSTNQGVHIELPIVRIPDHSRLPLHCWCKHEPQAFIIVLNCFYYDLVARHPAIVVHRSVKDPGMDHFVRLGDTPLMAIHHEVIQAADLRTMMLSKKLLQHPLVLETPAGRLTNRSMAERFKFPSKTASSKDPRVYDCWPSVQDGHYCLADG
ncbi:hypothetical protein ACN47E_008650 [Coniothyrium glycines]